MSEKQVIPVQKTLFSDLNETEQLIYNLLVKEGELTIDIICRTLGIPVNKLSSLLLQMEFRGLIRSYPGNLYRV